MSQRTARATVSTGLTPPTGPGILLGASVQAALSRGIDTMVVTVRPTLGPLPRTVAVLDVDSGRPIEVLDDAATILRRTIELPDPYVNMGAMILRHAVWQTYEAVGDGGATTAVLLQAIIRQVSPYIAAGGDPVALRRHLDRALAAATEALRQQSRPLDGQDEIAGAALAICHDPALAKMLGEILEIIGPDGCLLIENGYGAALTRQYVEGVHWNEGYRSPYFVTDKDAQEVRLDSPMILISDLRLTEAGELVPLLDRLVEAHCPSLLVIADEVSGSALSLLLANHRGGEADPILLRRRIKEVKAELAATEPGDEREQVRQRLGKLMGGVAPGGGAAYLGCRDALRAPAASIEEKVAFQALEAALERPLAVIAASAGFDPHAVLAEVQAAPSWWGFDACAGEVVDMWRTGIVDPLPVLQKALEVAVSGAVMALSSEVLVHKRAPLAVAKP